ncbi:M15 family metallopeptidase [Cellulomonas sp. URHE0023]|uniref:M15 family metallopeptidase n=1 Tax=Cellulomonas sp. URHE0023 TaxID=1380354 RepID=UPI00068AE369|nr:M15 family metallopeptidase [Cellulomonas sp. URHE0023]
MIEPRLTPEGRHSARPRQGRRPWESVVVLASMVFVTAAVAAPLSDVSHSTDVPQAATGAQVPVTDESRGPARTQALELLDDRVAAVEAATVALVGHPLDDTTKAASRTLIRSDVVDAPTVPVTPGLTAEQLPDRVVGAREQVATGDVDAAARVVEGVETDVLLVALDLGDQSAQNAAITRLLVSTDPQVALLDAAVGATHAAAEARDVVAAATSAVQARDAAAGITVAAQQVAVAGDEEDKAAAAKVQEQARSTDGYTNGSIPLKALCTVAFAPSQHLRCDAADALERLNDAYRVDFGHDLLISGSYRTLEEQISTRAAKGTMAAVPGTSNHGWGLAIDLDQSNGYRSAQYTWLKANAMTYGWHHPTYMDEGGRGPHEPWHWEFGTSDDAGTGTSVPITVGVPAPSAPTQSQPAPPVVDQPSSAPTEPAPTPTATPTATPTPSSGPTESAVPAAP